VKALGVFDIGSNTILITVGRLSPSGSLEILWDEGDVVRLSEGLQDGGELQDDAKERALKTLTEFKQGAERLGVRHFLAAGTAAFRRAKDGRDFAQEIQKKLGIPVRILKGEEEAAYSYLSAELDFSDKGEDFGMIDIGGGSTELVFGKTDTGKSLPMGTVKLTELFRPEHPIPDKTWEAIQSEIRRLLREAFPNLPPVPRRWVAVAATPASLAAVLLELSRYDPTRIHGFRMTLPDLSALLDKLRHLSLAERQALPGMHPKRAELLPIGGLILQEAMHFLNIPEILVSDHGLRYGILWEEIKKGGLL